MFHIVFDKRGAELISEAMDMDEALDGETILIRDDYSVGPIANLFSEAGMQERRNWWSSIGEEKESLRDESSSSPDEDVVRGMVQRMREEEFDQVWIWTAPNSRDVSGYYWLISQLKDFIGRVHVLSLNNLPFIGEKGTVFYPISLSEIPKREFIKARKLARPVTAAEFETDPDEWVRLASENKNLRLLEGGKKIIHQSDEYYDRQLLNFLQPAFQKIPRTIQQFLLKFPDRLNESFLLWRLKQLIASGAAEQQGEAVRVTVKETASFPTSLSS